MKRLALCLGLFVSMGGMSTEASAFEEVSHPGSDCSPARAQDVPLWLKYYTLGMNQGATDALVSCPVARPNPSSAANKVWPVVYVRGVAGKTLSCTFAVADVYGKSVKTVTKSTTVGGDQALYFADITYPSASWGSYAVWCTLPGSGRVNGYYVYDY